MPGVEDLLVEGVHALRDWRGEQVGALQERVGVVVSRRPHHRVDLRESKPGCREHRPFIYSGWILVYSSGWLWEGLIYTRGGHRFFPTSDRKGSNTRTLKGPESTVILV